MSSWLKLDRGMLNWEWYDHVPTKTLFLHLLLKANYKASRYRGYEVPAGSMVSGISKLSEQTGLSIKQVRTALNNLKKTDEVAIKATNKFSIISIVKWSQYQTEDNQRANNGQTEDNQRATSKEYIINNTTLRDTREVVESSNPDREHIFVGKQVLSAMGISHDDPKFFGSYGIVEMWMNGGWCPERDIIPTIQSLMASRFKDKDPPSMKYFTKAIADAYATRTTSAPKGTAYANTSQFNTAKPPRSEGIQRAKQKALEGRGLG